MSSLRFMFAFCLVASIAPAQETYKAELLKSAAPDDIAEPIKKDLADSGVRVLNGQGKPFAEIWLRKGIPASGKLDGAKGVIQFPVIAEGELLGVVKFIAEGHDFRDQSIPPGVYTLRYGLQPVNGDHLGVSPFRDYGLLLPASKDVDLALLARKKLETQSAETTGASHPAVLMLIGLPAGTKADPKIVRDDEKNTSGAILAFPLVSGKGGDREVLTVQLVISGMAM